MTKQLLYLANNLIKLLLFVLGGLDMQIKPAQKVKLHF